MDREQEKMVSKIGISIIVRFIFRVDRGISVVFCLYCFVLLPYFVEY